MSERESNLQNKKPDQAAQVHRAPEAAAQVEQGGDRREAFNGIQRNFGNKVASGVARSAATAQTATPNFGLDKAEYANYKSRADNGFNAIDKGKNSKQMTAAIEEAHRLFGLPIAEIRDVICIESSGNHLDKANKNSNRSASGLMQVTGETWEEINKQLNRKHKALTADHKGKEELFQTIGEIKDLPFEGNWQNIRYNVLFATSYIVGLKDKFGTVGNTLMSYNAGPGTITIAKAIAEARAQKDPAAALKEVFSKYTGTKTRTSAVGSAISLEQCFNKYGKTGSSKSVQAAENLKPAIDYYGVWSFYKNKKGLSEEASVEKKFVETSNYAKGSDLIMSLDPKKDTAGGGTTPAAPVATPVTAPSAPATTPAAPSKGPAKRELSAAEQQALLAKAYGDYKSIKQGDALAERLAYIIFNNMYPSRNSRSDKFGYPFSPDVTPADGALYTEYQALKSKTSAYVQQKSQPAAEKPAPEGPAASQPVSAPGGTTEKPATPVGKPAGAPVKDTGDKFYDQVRKNFPDGVTVSVLTNFTSKGNDAEFGRQATTFAQNENPVAIVKGQLVLGGTTKIEGMADAVTKVNAIRNMLVAKDKEHGGNGNAAFTKIKNLSIFTHGIPNAVDLSPGGGQFPLRESNVGDFVGSIAGSLKPDVRVQLFSCSTARNNDKEAYADWAEHRKGVRTGDTSFANSMAQALNKQFEGQASVYAHSTRGHTTNNYAARVFGKDAGGGNGGLQIFELMYTDAFIKSEAARLKKDAAVVREEMWSHYKKHATAGTKMGGAPISHEMFANIENATHLLQNDWLTSHGGKPIATAPATPVPAPQTPAPKPPTATTPAPKPPTATTPAPAPQTPAPAPKPPTATTPAPVAKTLEQDPARIAVARDAVNKAAKAGEKDKYDLANAGWYALHPNRKDTAIKKSETTFMAEYKYILANIVAKIAPSADRTPEGSAPATTVPVAAPVNSGSGDALDKLLGFTKSVPRYNAAQIQQARQAIVAQPAAERKQLYAILQTKVNYHNQRNNASTNSAGSKIGDVMCNLTSLAMALEALGMTNPKPDQFPQFEDYLENLGRRNIKGFTRTLPEHWGKVAKLMGADVKMFAGGVHNKAWWMSNAKPQLESGNGMMMSIAGHIVRLQGVTEKGLIVDDPYGASTLQRGEKRGWAGSNARTGDSGDGAKGEDHVYSWASVEQHSMRWVAAFSK